jgi:hypothetical protein
MKTCTIACIVALLMAGCSSTQVSTSDPAKLASSGQASLQSSVPNAENVFGAQRRALVITAIDKVPVVAPARLATVYAIKPGIHSVTISAVATETRFQNSDRYAATTIVVFDAKAGRQYTTAGSFSGHNATVWIEDLETHQNAGMSSDVALDLSNFQSPSPPNARQNPWPTGRTAGG